MTQLIFINYRRSDSQEDAVKLRDKLDGLLSNTEVFVDLEDIAPGTKWKEYIHEKLSSADLLITVIGANWLGACYQNFRRRLDDESDWVRKEIEFAIANSILIIPILVSGGKIPDPKDLPESLQPLVDYQCFEVREEHFDEDVKSLVVDHLNRIGFKPAPPREFQVAKEDYFKQLAKWFDDVKFAGIAVAGQEVEKSEKLENIFVMPDVQEDLTVKDYSVIDNEKLNEIIFDTSLGQRQQELFLEQRQRALSNRSGEKFLAAQLLTEKNSKKQNSQKFVLLGAPGSGKTTLLSYFAVMLAQNEEKKAENQEKLGLDHLGCKQRTHQSKQRKIKVSRFG